MSRHCHAGLPPSRSCQLPVYKNTQRPIMESMRDAPTPTPTTGLILTGGGARAAYQVGVLEAISDIRRACGQGKAPNPFPIIAGTSAGAMNAAALACGADNFDVTVRMVAQAWRNVHVDQVYRADHLSMLRSGAKWMTLLSLGWLLAKWRRIKPRSLLDNTPLRGVLEQLVPLERLPDLIRQGHIQALAVTASSYSSGEHVTFFEGDKRLMPWTRSQRISVRDRITHEHLLASSAIPFVFPASWTARPPICCRAGGVSGRCWRRFLGLAKTGCANRR